MSRYKQVWTSSNGLEFEINKLELDENGATWVWYTNTKTGVKYHCLRDAFLDRFSERQV